MGVGTKAWQCDRCGEDLTPRGGVLLKFCPRCGQRVGRGVDAAARRVTSTGRRVSGAAIVSFLLGLAGLVPACWPVGLSAIVVGVLARTSINESPDKLTGRGLALAGIFLGIIGSAVWLAMCAAVL
jgi:predicted RNA-binding Zn-ribbon protein involved in translation (DUF1610 family)